MAIVNPTPANANSVHVDAALSDFATAYENREMIADSVCPIIKVDKRSDVFHKRTRRGSSHIVKDLIGPKSRANETTYETTTGTYIVQDRGLMDVVDYSMSANADDALNPEQETVMDIMTKLMLAREVRVATLLCATGSYASGSTGAVGGAIWSNEATGTPIADINGARAAIPPGGPGSKLVAFCALEVWNALRKHPSVLSLKGLKEGMLSKDEFASYFEIDQLLVSDAQKDTNNIGQDASYSRIWTSTVFGMVRVPVSPSKRSTLFAATFRYGDIQTSTWEEPSLGVIGGKGVRTSFSDDEVVCQNDMGYLLTGCL